MLASYEKSPKPPLISSEGKQGGKKKRFKKSLVAILVSPLAIPVNEYESSCALKSEFSYTSTSSGCSSYSSPTSLTSYATTNYNSSYYSSPTSLTSYESNYNANLMQRSISSHSLLHRNNVEGFSALVSSPTACYDSETSPFRKVFSAGDLEGMTPKQHSRRADSSLANEYSIIESMSKACRYSPEEKKERIERYRSKRNLRNFNKKIKYECRKTLADSRPASEGGLPGMMRLRRLLKINGIRLALRRRTKTMTTGLISLIHSQLL
nr:uncharacterized protein LOC113742579 [Coffea arabica]